MKKQKCGFEGIYDLFAIRIILDSPEDKEKMQPLDFGTESQSRSRFGFG